MSLILIAALALASDPQAAATPAAPPPGAKPAKPKMICVDDTPLGSRIAGRRICRTAAEWDGG